MDTKFWAIILASAFGLVIVGAIIVNNLESSGRLSAEAIGPEGVAATQILFFALFCIICFVVVPVIIGVFIAGQIKIGNGEFFAIKWLQTHERVVIYGVWVMLAIGLCFAIPAAIKDGMFK